MGSDQEEAPLTTAEVSRFSRDELLAALVDSEHRTRAEEARKMVLLTEAVSRNVAADTEYRSVVELLRDTLHVPRDELTRRLACAKAVSPAVTPTGAELPPALPATAEALAAGQVGLDHVKVIATLHSQLPDTVHPDDWTATEHTLATLATQADSRAVARAARYARERLDPDGREPKESTERATRELDVLRMRDGSARGTFRLDPESAAILDLLTSALGKPRPTRDGVRDPRSLLERHGDAFADILRLALDSLDLPAEAGERPHLVITMRLSDLQQQLRGAVLHDGRDLTAAEARRHACDATLIPSVLGTHSEPLDLGRGHRLINLALRRALILRDRGCTFPNCDRPARWCAGHHIVPWFQGGPLISPTVPCSAQPTTH